MIMNTRDYGYVYSTQRVSVFQKTNSVRHCDGDFCCIFITRYSSTLYVSGPDKLCTLLGGFFKMHCGYGWVPMDHTNTVTWVPCNSGDPLPNGAVHVGTDKDGDKLYAGRAFHEGDLLPAKINPTHSSAYVCWGGLEHAMSHFEVLCNANVSWQSLQGGDIPPNAIVIGATLSGEKLYMGRALHEGTLTPGKIQPSHRTLYIPYNGEEVAVEEYEIMVYRPFSTMN